MGVHKQETATIKNKTGKLFEFMWNYEMHYLQPDQEWSCEKRVGEILSARYFDQLEIVDEGQQLGIPPTEDPNATKTYSEMNPKASKSKVDGKPWCVTCGQKFNSGGQLMMHRKKHEKEARLAKKEAEVEA